MKGEGQVSFLKSTKAEAIDQTKKKKRYECYQGFDSLVGL